MTLYGDPYSGNCYKVLLLASLLQRPLTLVRVDVVGGEVKELIKLNPNAKVPILKWQNADGAAETLWESNAILHYLAEDTQWLPGDALTRARMLQWQFFEQYSHEPYIAVARYIQRFLGLPPERQAEHQAKQAGGHKALAVMEQALSQQPYLCGQQPSLADISLYAYTHVADEGGFALQAYPAIQAWLARIGQWPGYRSMASWDQAEKSPRQGMGQTRQ
ncbi:glutathione S-transferase family protein [Ferrimonas marina]|nr:glutathione S-transferase family protein [Ferrimonas marina]